jgi:enamine deaminase RidA (YjgF/YER057c/UK114 family)
MEAGQGIEAQSRLAFQNLQKVISEAGGSLEDVVELVTFHTSMADMKVFSKVKSEFFPENYPAWTAVGVTELALPSLLIEVRATAVIGSGAGKKA